MRSSGLEGGVSREKRSYPDMFGFGHSIWLIASLFIRSLALRGHKVGIT